jgi:hypothetical protein
LGLFGGKIVNWELWDVKWVAGFLLFQLRSDFNRLCWNGFSCLGLCYGVCLIGVCLLRLVDLVSCRSLLFLLLSVATFLFLRFSGPWQLNAFLCRFLCFLLFLLPPLFLLLPFVLPTYFLGIDLWSRRLLD